MWARRLDGVGPTSLAELAAFLILNTLILFAYGVDLNPSIYLKAQVCCSSLQQFNRALKQRTRWDTGKRTDVYH